MMVLQPPMPSVSHRIRSRPSAHEKGPNPGAKGTTGWEEATRYLAISDSAAGRRESMGFAFVSMGIWKISGEEGLLLVGLR